MNLHRESMATIKICGLLVLLLAFLPREERKSQAAKHDQDAGKDNRGPLQRRKLQRIVIAVKKLRENHVPTIEGQNGNLAL